MLSKLNLCKRWYRICIKTLKFSHLLNLSENNVQRGILLWRQHPEVVLPSFRAAWWWWGERGERQGEMAAGRQEWTGSGTTETKLRWPWPSGAVRRIQPECERCCPACTRTLSPCLPAHPGGEQPSSARYPACLSGYLTAPQSPAGSFIVTPCGPVSSVCVSISLCMSAFTVLMAMSCIMRSADHGWLVWDHNVTLLRTKPRSEPADQTTPSDTIRLTLFGPHAWMNRGLLLLHCLHHHHHHHHHHHISISSI